MARDERTHWRDQALVAWHQRGNLHCRAAGVQLLLLEYVWGRPVALIEYRRYEDGVPNFEQAIYRAIGELAGDLPFYAAFYTTDFGFYVLPLNATARAKLGNRGRLVSEAGFVRGLHNGLRDGIAREPPYGEFTLPVLFDRKPPAPPNAAALVPHLLDLDPGMYAGHALSVRRRRWGRNAPCVDLDYLLIDYNTAKPVALIEYKSIFARDVDLDSRFGPITALRAFASGRVPFAVVRYWRDPVWQFLPIEPERPVRSEHEWIARLTALRRRATG